MNQHQPRRRSTRYEAAGGQEQAELPEFPDTPTRAQGTLQTPQMASLWCILVGFGVFFVSLAACSIVIKALPKRDSLPYPAPKFA